jgi:hypothetical protein
MTPTCGFNELLADRILSASFQYYRHGQLTAEVCPERDEVFMAIVTLPLFSGRASQRTDIADVEDDYFLCEIHCRSHD